MTVVHTLPGAHMIHRGYTRSRPLRLVLSLAICVLLGSCGSRDANHSAVGSWKNDRQLVRIYSDHTASIAGVAARWVKIDANAVRLEANIRSVDYSWEFRVAGNANADASRQQPRFSESSGSQSGRAGDVETGVKQTPDEPAAEYRVDPVTGYKTGRPPQRILDMMKRGQFMAGGPAKSETAKRIESAQAGDGELGQLYRESGQPELFVRANNIE